MSPPDQKASDMLLKKSRETAAKRMERLDQGGKATQLWTCLLVTVRFDALKNNIACKPGMLGP